MSAKLGLKQKMVCLCLMFSAVGIAVGATGYLGLNSVVTEYGRVSDISLPHLTAANDMFLNYRRVRIALRTLGLPGLAAVDAERAVKDVKQAIADYEATNAEYKRQPFSPGESELYAQVEKDWEAFKAVGARALALHASGSAADREKMLDIFFHECPEQAQAYTDAMQALLAFHKKNASQWVKQAHETKDATSRIMLWTVILGVGTGMAIGCLLASTISKAINRVARGLAERAAKVAEEIHHIAEASQNLSSSATQQAAALQQTTAAIDETSSMVDKNAENAKKSSEVSGTSQESAARGQEVVTQMIRSIEDISNSNADIMAQIEASNREIGEIVKVIGEIGSKTKVINDIVFQTKLLSFNASVEAARAGEQGKGFAVVAEEVGNLAAMSGNAAREISEMLEASVQRVEQIVSNTGTRVESLIRTGKEKVEGGTVMAQRCGEVLDEVVKNVTLVGSLVSEISSASREQAIGVQEISRAMEQLDQAAQENSAASQQSSKTAEALRESVADLHQLVGQLNRTVHGADHPDVAARAA